MQIDGQTFVVSGGSSGLGAACVRMLVAKGANVVIADINEEKGQSLVGELGSATIFAQTDVTDEESVRAAVMTAEVKFGNLRGSIQCAGIALAEKILGKNGVHSLETFTRTIHINLLGTFNMLRFVAEGISRNEPLPSDERGVIINTASVAAYEGQIGQIAYAASKGGVVAMTLPAARELARSGIRVVTIAPGVFDTPLMAALPEAARTSLSQQIPFPSRFGKPEEYAFLAQHILENEMINGETIRLDGAIRMAPK